jgi:signal transduction histidine kinase
LRRANETLEHEVRERTEYIRLLQDVAVIANESESVEQAFHLALERVLRFKPWEAAHVVVRSRTEPEEFIDAGIWTVERGGRYRRLIAAGSKMVFRTGQGLVGRVIAAARPEWVTNVAADGTSLLGPHLAACGLVAAVACPVLIGNEVAAVVEFFSAKAAPPDDLFLEIMQHVGTPLGRVIERARLQRQLVDAVWDQHRRFGQELHDTLGQALTGIGMFADSLAKRLAGRSEPEAERLAELVSMIQQAKSEARQLAKGLYPVDVDAQGLLAALEELALTTTHRAQVRCVFKGDRDIHLRDNEVATHLFRIAQEAVHNAVKHGRPRRISIALTRPRGHVTLAVRDDGSSPTGGSPEPSSGLGMRIMKYRANSIGAELFLGKTSSGGTLIRCTLKREENHAPADHR